ncbi:MAG: sodium:solute symporter family protein [Bacteroidales bacterium]|nr:sodium:solute symporter family protein [Bacteroidales bacterium]
MTHIVGILLTVGLLLVIGVMSGRKVKDARGFAIGGKAGSWMVCGIIMGTLVGGQSTIGTSQMAYCYGLSAWLFSAGVALGSLILGLVYTVPLRRSGCMTLAEIIAKEYGHKAETIGSLLCMTGMFISIVSQVIASTAMMTSMFEMEHTVAAVLSAALIAAFVFFGGIRSAGLGGILKLVLLYVASLTAAVVVWRLSGSIGNVYDSLHEVMETPTIADLNGLSTSESIDHRYANPVGRGVAKDIGSAISLILGVLATQTYAQGIWAARSDRHARRGAVWSALLVPVIGAACTLIGLYMRGHYITHEEQAALLAAGEQVPEGVRVIAHTAEVFPRFILDNCPAWIGGIVLGTLFVTILGGGSGLTLGTATILVRDVFSNIPRRDGGHYGESKSLYRFSIVFLVGMALLVSLLNNRTLINELGFLSLGLRATALLVPLSAALFMPGRFKRYEVIMSMVVGCVTMIAASSLSLPGDAIFWGMGSELLIMAAASVYRKHSH